MLRITVRDQPDIRIVLEGRLVSDWVSELRSCCEQVLSRSGAKPVSLELADVSFVDAAGKEFLAALSRQGVHLISDDAAMDALVTDIVSSRCENAKRQRQKHRPAGSRKHETTPKASIQSISVKQH
jgi:ABC-type transporter Mla MlaB component